jgi:hypothetical protein
MTLSFRTPFPEDNIFLRVMAIRSAPAFLFFKYSYTLFLYTTPYIAYSILLSRIYIFALKAGRKIRAGRLPLYPGPRKWTELSIVVGEVHHPRKPMPSETPRWLVIPERGLFTGIAIVGAVGSGKTVSCMYPFAEQILAYRAEDSDSRIGRLARGEDPEEVIRPSARYCSYKKSNPETYPRLTIPRHDLTCAEKPLPWEHTTHNGSKTINSTIIGGKRHDSCCSR